MNNTRLLYCGERYDSVNGTFHLGNGYRQYHPALMRFSCPDSMSPFGAGGVNFYVYCSGDPVNFADPTGHMSWQGIAGIVTGMLALAVSVYTAGASVVAEGSIIAALTMSSAISGAFGVGDVIACVTAVASCVEENRDPKAAAILGWVSLAAGLPSLLGGATVVSRALFGKATTQIQAWFNNYRRGKIAVNLHPENAFPLRFYKAISIENDMHGRRLGYLSDVGGSGQPGLCIHGSEHSGYLTYDEGVSRGRQELSVFLTLPSMLEHLKARFSIDLSMDTGTPLHFISCFSGGTGRNAQQLARLLGRPVIGYGDREPVYFIGLYGVGDRRVSVMVLRNARIEMIEGIIYHPDGSVVNDTLTTSEFFRRLANS